MLTIRALSPRARAFSIAASTIDCDAAADPPFDKTTDATGDATFTKLDLQPGTYTCVIVIDP